MVGVIGLDDDPSRTIAATGPSGHLGEKLEGALAGAKVGQIEQGIGRDHAGQGDSGKVVALGDHLGADKDLGVARREGPERSFEAVAASHGVAIEDHRSDVGVELGQMVGHFLGAGSDGIEESAVA
jgi:hypothetical protein